jgi:hypothetical protein
MLRFGVDQGLTESLHSLTPAGQYPKSNMLVRWEG